MTFDVARMQNSNNQPFASDTLTEMSSSRENLTKLPSVSETLTELPSANETSPERPRRLQRRGGVRRSTLKQVQLNTFSTVAFQV